MQATHTTNTDIQQGWLLVFHPQVLYPYVSIGCMVDYMRAILKRLRAVSLNAINNYSEGKMK